jgi:ferredoxin
VILGTPLKFVLDYAGAPAVDALDARQVILGGPMMGQAIGSLDVPITKGVSGVLVFRREDMQERESRQTYPCIKCGECVESCPMGLNPSTLGMLAAKREYDLMGEQYFLGDCFECGCCTYVCPSNIPLVQQFRVCQADPAGEGGMTAANRNPLRAARAIDQDGRDHHAQRGVSLLPICAFYVFQYGISALASIAVVTGACLLTERFFVGTGTQAGRLSDYSAVITGLLLALTLPPGFPLWMGAVAGIVAIALGKALFGGIGFNVFNPALVGRAFVQAAFPTAIATYTPSFLPGRFTEFIPSTLAWPLMIPADPAPGSRPRTSMPWPGRRRWRSGSSTACWPMPTNC